jgi:hypothetical protein
LSYAALLLRLLSTGFSGEESFIEPALQDLIRAALYEENSVTFNALLATKDGEKIWTNVVELDERDLMSSDVIIAVDYSTVNYKDGVDLTGRTPIIQRFPRNALTDSRSAEL